MIAHPVAVLCIVWSCCVLVSCSSEEDGRQVVRVSCAASAADVIETIAKQFEAKHPQVDVRINAGSSSTLARQIEAGVPCDVYLSANQQWVDRLEAASMIDAGTRVDLLGNRLVLIAHHDDDAAVEIAAGEAGINWLSDERLAIGDPAHVPGGRYARQAMEALAWWAVLEPLIVPCMDVRSALQFVASQQARFGIVYATDARISKRVRVVAVFDESLHEPIVYPAVLTPRAPDEAAQLFAYFQGEAAADVFRDAGFVVLPSER